MTYYSDKYRIINSNIPTVGSIAICDEGTLYGHVAYVESVNGNIITTLNGGFQKEISKGVFVYMGHIERISGTASELKITGYWKPNKPKDSEPPKISNIKYSDLTSDGYTVSATVTDNVGVSAVYFPTWTQNNDKDDLIQHKGTKTGTNTWSFTVKVQDHKWERGLYHTHVYADDTSNNRTPNLRE